MAFKFNPLSAQLDLVNPPPPPPVPFNTDSILTHSLTPFGWPLKSFDPAIGVYYDKGFEIVFDLDGNIVTL